MLQAQRKISLRCGVLFSFVSYAVWRTDKKSLNTTKQFSICKRMDVIITTDIIRYWNESWWVTMATLGLLVWGGIYSKCTCCWFVLRLKPSCSKHQFRQIYWFMTQIPKLKGSRLIYLISCDTVMNFRGLHDSVHRQMYIV